MSKDKTKPSSDVVAEAEALIDEWELDGTDRGDIITALIAQNQEIQAKIEGLEAEIELLK